MGLIIKRSRNPSIKQTNASIMNGTGFPQNSYKNPPKGGATRQPKEINARAIPRALVLSASSVYLEIISYSRFP